jgi:hypothetical protein
VRRGRSSLARSLRFGSRLEREEALAKNGRVVSGCMIGVLYGIHPAAHDSKGGLEDGAEKQTVWLAPTRPELQARSVAREPLAHSGASMPVGSNGALMYSGIGGVLMRVTEYLFGW